MLLNFKWNLICTIIWMRREFDCVRHSISKLEPITGRKSETAIPRNIDGSRIGKTIRRSRYYVLLFFRCLLFLPFLFVFVATARVRVAAMLSNLDSRALLGMTARERWALGNPETGVFLIGFREEQRTLTWLVHSNEIKSLLNALLCERRQLNMRERKSFLLLEILGII